jgi:acyl carrier protein
MKSDATQLTVAELWAEVLDRQVPPEADDNFFDLGGDSIAMVTLLYRVQEEFSVELAAGALFGAPSVRELSALIDATRAGADLP